MLAFLAIDGISLAVGGTLLALVPMHYVQVGSGIVFLVFGIVPLLRKEKAHSDSVIKKKSSAMPLFATFSLIALMELGDKSQIIAVTFAAQTSLIPVLIGLILAFTLLTGVAVFVGAKYVSRLPMKWLKIGTPVLFIILGVISIVSGILQISLF
jgi:putative Ca2+/H+ antiporter (TMEM165/GDT1 family)